MGFGDLKTEGGVKDLNNFLTEKSFIEGFVPSQSDLTVFTALNKPPTSSTPHAQRWYNNIKSYSEAERKAFPGVKKDISAFCTGSGDKAEEDDDVDLFGSDDEEEDAAAAKIREERLKAYHEKKSKKPALIAKTSVLLDVKPWDDETNMQDMESEIRKIEKDGLVWGASKLVPVGYGIKKLQIMCVVEDEKVSIDELNEQICEFEDFVQSVDIAAMSKI